MVLNYDFDREVREYAIWLDSNYPRKLVSENGTEYLIQRGKLVDCGIDPLYPRIDLTEEQKTLIREGADSFHLNKEFQSLMKNNSSFEDRCIDTLVIDQAEISYENLKESFYLVLKNSL